MISECPGRTRFQKDLEYAAMGAYDFDLLKNSTVLVTGATGLVGGALVRAILCANRIRGLNARVLAPVRSLEKAKKALSGCFDRPEIRVFEADIMSPMLLHEPIDYIVHAAGVTTSKLFVTQPVETIRVSVLSCMSLLELAREKNVRGMVYLSSMEAFGVTDPALPMVSEEQIGYINPQSVRSSYSESKRMAECLCASFAHEYGVPVRAARLAQTFGAGVGEGESRAFMQFAKSALSGENIVLHTKGESYGNYVYTADCVLALLMLLTRGENGGVYTVSNESACVRIRDLASIAAETLSDPPVSVIFDIPDDPLKFGYAPDVKMHLSSKKMQALGWQAKTQLTDMFRFMAEDLSEQKK